MVKISIKFLEFMKMQKFVQIKKLQIQNQNCLISVFLRCKFKKLLSYFKSAFSNFFSILEFLKMQSLPYYKSHFTDFQVLYL